MSREIAFTHESKIKPFKRTETKIHHEQTYNTKKEKKSF